MRKIRKGVCMRSNLILFVLVLVNQNFIGTRDEDDEEDDEDDSCCVVAQRAKATSGFCPLPSDLCLLSSVPYQGRETQLFWR